MPLGFRPSDQGDPHRAAHDRPELERILENHYDDATRYVPPSLINDIHDGGRAIAIVIDDWHRMTSIETVAVMTFMFENRCHHVQVIIATRSQAGLPLSLMRVRDEIVWIEPTAMRFDSAESKDFLVGVNGLALKDGEVSSLRRPTDGWVAACNWRPVTTWTQRSPGLHRTSSGGHRGIHENMAETF